MEKRRAVVITGLGVISPIGLSVPEAACALVNPASGIVEMSLPPMGKSFPAGRVARSFTDCFTRLELLSMDRCQQMAVLAAREAIADAGLGSFAADGRRAGLYYGNVHGGAATGEASLRQLFAGGRHAAQPFSAMAFMHNGGAAQISIRHQILGPVHTYGSACASSSAAIGEAGRAIRDGCIDVGLAGGAEGPLAASMVSIFDATRAMAPLDPHDPGRSCRPFSPRRSGFVLGEGAAFVVLEEEGRARRRGVNVYGYLAGYGVAADAYHIAAPNMAGQSAAIRAALSDASLAPSAIDYLNAHATATRNGDIVEAAAIREVFGDPPNSVPVSSTKSIHGHLLGAAGALEFLLTVLAVRDSILPATAYLEEADPACALNHIAGKPALHRPVERAMSFSCGFGGTNVALIVSKHRETPY